jgi:hypothetical protein
MWDCVRVILTPQYEILWMHPSTSALNCYASLLCAFPAFPAFPHSLDVALSTGVSGKVRGITMSQYSLSISVWSSGHAPEGAGRKCKWPNEGRFEHDHSRNSWAFVLRLQYSNGWLPFVLKLKTHRSACSPTWTCCGWSERAYEIWGSHSSEGSYFYHLGNDTVYISNWLPSYQSNILRPSRGIIPWRWKQYVPLKCLWPTIDWQLPDYSVLTRKIAMRKVQQLS